MAVTPKLIVDVTIDDGEPITIKEGDTLTEVKYMENGGRGNRSWPCYRN